MKLSHLLLAAAVLAGAPVALHVSAAQAQEPGVFGGGDRDQDSGEASRITKKKPKSNKAPTGLAKLLDSGDIPNAGPCPVLGVLYDASRKVEFTSADEKFANVAFTGELNGVRGLCRYIGSDPIKMSIDIDMAFGRGPAAQSERKTYRYWVAVTRSNLAPIAKQYFDVDVDFKGSDRTARTEKIEQIVIPRANEGISGANFEILVGFDLTPQQLAFNREGKRFRVDAGQGQ